MIRFARGGENGRGHALLLHGAGGGGWEWNVWRGVLAAKGIHTRTPDLRPATAGLVATTFDDYRGQSADALASLPRPRVVIGASLGGLLAACAADAVEADALVLVNPLPPAPWSAQMPVREWPDLVPWQRDGRLAATRRALPDADDATALYAFRHWRDESGAVLRDARGGIAIPKPTCPVLCIASARDEDVPSAITGALAQAWSADLVEMAGMSHVGPLLGRDAALPAARVADWLLTLPCFAYGSSEGLLTR